MNLDLEQLYKLRHAMNIAAVHDELNVNDELFEIVEIEIKKLENELENITITKDDLKF